MSNGHAGALRIGAKLAGHHVYPSNLPHKSVCWDPPHLSSTSIHALWGHEAHGREAGWKSHAQWSHAALQRDSAADTQRPLERGISLRDGLSSKTAADVEGHEGAFCLDEHHGNEASANGDAEVHAAWCAEEQRGCGGGGATVAAEGSDVLVQATPEMLSRYIAS